MAVGLQAPGTLVVLVVGAPLVMEELLLCKVAGCMFGTGCNASFTYA